MFLGFLIDSNASCSPLLRDPKTSPVFIPASVLLESYKHADIPSSVEQSFGCFRGDPNRVHILRDFGSLSQCELGAKRSLTVTDVVDEMTTAKIRQALQSGIGEFHRRHLDIIQGIRRRQESIRNGLLNLNTNRVIASSVGGTVLDHLPVALHKKYRARSPDAWLSEPLDEELISAAIFTVDREMRNFLQRRGFRGSEQSHFLRRNPLMFRMLSIAFVRRFVNESGNTLANWQRNPAQSAFTNERIDIDVCALASLFRNVVTNDTSNKICLRYLHRIMEINRRMILAPTGIVYSVA